MGEIMKYWVNSLSPHKYDMEEHKWLKMILKVIYASYFSSIVGYYYSPQWLSSKNKTKRNTWCTIPLTQTGDRN